MAAEGTRTINVSALMSGVMIKTGIYGMVRVFFDFLGRIFRHGGVLILVVAVSSSVLVCSTHSWNTI
jgi:hydrogenase-4 component B